MNIYSLRDRRESQHLVEMNQEKQALLEQASQIVQFMDLSPAQQQALILAGRNHGGRSIIRMVGLLRNLADELPASAWE